jgi:hypothetical protein
MYSRLIILFSVAVLPSLFSAEQESPLTPESMPNLAAVPEIQTPAVVETVNKEISPFTGKITGDKVRLRLAPTLDGSILSELNKDDLVVVTGEIDEFYTVKPFPSTKAYIYRAYVLDDVVEANNVNIRLEPNNHSPILSQLNQGDRVSGMLCPNNNKWLEIYPPESVRFYVSKTYVTNAGDETLFQKTEEKRQKLKCKLSSIQESLQKEMKKPFAGIQIVPMVDELKAIATESQDLRDLAKEAETMIQTAQEQYISLSQNKAVSQKEKREEGEQVAFSEQANFYRFASFALEKQERNLVEQAIVNGDVSSQEEFYLRECNNAEEMTGQLIPYERTSSTRPGDFMLVDIKTKVPVAYLYSITIDLKEFIGRNITVVVSFRPNHHYALPAFFVHEARSAGAKAP